MLYRGKPGYFKFVIRSYGRVQVHFRYGGPENRTDIVLGTLPDSPTPLLDLVLKAQHKLDAGELARLRDVDKSWNRLASLLH